MPKPHRARQEIGRRIKEIRLKRGLTLQQLADLAKISAGYLSDVERGESAPSAEKLAAIAAKLGTTVDYLLTGTNPPGSVGAEVIPAGLADAALRLDLTYNDTIRLLAGKNSLRARRSDKEESDWTAEQWIEFYNKVAPYL